MVYILLLAHLLPRYLVLPPEGLWHGAQQSSTAQDFGVNPALTSEEKTSTDYSIQEFFIYCIFLRGAQNIAAAFPPRIKAAACFAITWLFKCKAALNPCGSSSTNRVRRNVRISAFSSLPVSQIPTFWPQSGGCQLWMESIDTATDQDGGAGVLESGMCCYSCHAFEDVFWPTDLSAVAHTTTSHRGDSSPFCPLRCGSYLPFVVFLSPVSVPAAPSVRPVLVNLVRSLHGALCFRHSPSAPPFRPPEKMKKIGQNEMRTLLSQCRPRFFGGMRNGARTTVGFSLRANLNDLYALLALLRDGGDRRRENILSICRILAARHFALAMMQPSVPVWASAMTNYFTSSRAFIWWLRSMCGLCHFPDGD